MKTNTLQLLLQLKNNPVVREICLDKKTIEIVLFGWNHLEKQYDIYDCYKKRIQLFFDTEKIVDKDSNDYHKIDVDGNKILYEKVSKSDYQLLNEIMLVIKKHEEIFKQEAKSKHEKELLIEKIEEEYYEKESEMNKKVSEEIEKELSEIPEDTLLVEEFKLLTK